MPCETPIIPYGNAAGWHLLHARRLHHAFVTS